ncbi:hypothetical protein EDC04DRAFT_3018223 [Pisolithus marmoratus]|nr:hypothetical protein EDC04DRAFT_3018223 [Pisolithus marmoratus]
MDFRPSVLLSSLCLPLCALYAKHSVSCLAGLASIIWADESAAMHHCCTLASPLSYGLMKALPCTTAAHWPRLCHMLASPPSYKEYMARSRNLHPHIINEPTAAAVTYGLDKEKISEHNILICNPNSGVFDVSLTPFIEHPDKEVGGLLHVYEGESPTPRSVGKEKI